jgi:hypothetical protein
MRRRDFVVLFAAAEACRRKRPGQPKRIPYVGFLGAASREDYASQMEGFSRVA